MACTERNQLIKMGYGHGGEPFADLLCDNSSEE